MSTWLLTVYVLMWPAIVAGVLFVLVRGFMREWLAARREGRDII